MSEVIVESLSLADIHTFSQTQEGPVHYGHGWSVGNPNVKLGPELQLMAATLGSWLVKEQGWDLQAVVLWLENRNQKQSAGRSNRKIGERVSIIPKRFSAEFTFAADKPPIKRSLSLSRAGSKRLDIMNAFKPHEDDKDPQIYPPLYGATEAIFEASQIGPLQVWDVIKEQEKPEVYYLFGQKEKSYILDTSRSASFPNHTVRVDKEKKSLKTDESGVSLVFSIQAESFADRLRMEYNQNGRARYWLKKTHGPRVFL